jgi:hypothetical protein
MHLTAMARRNFDLTHDPHELNNLLPSVATSTIHHGFSPISPHVVKLVDMLDAIMSAAVTCRGEECLNPVAMLHNDRADMTFDQAMSPEYDDMYFAFEKFRFIQCEGNLALLTVL